MSKKNHHTERAKVILDFDLEASTDQIKVMIDPNQIFLQESCCSFTVRRFALFMIVRVKTIGQSPVYQYRQLYVSNDPLYGIETFTFSKLQPNTRYSVSCVYTKSVVDRSEITWPIHLKSIRTPAELR